MSCSRRTPPATLPLAPPMPAALEAEASSEPDRPALALGGDPVAVVDARAVHEDLVEVQVAVDLAQRPDLDPRLDHRQAEGADAGVLRHRADR